MLTARIDPAPSSTPPGVLLVGNFHSASSGLASVCDELSGRLKGSGWPVVTASHHRGRIEKIVDMVSTAWRARNRYDVAQIDLYSGGAFYWAEAAAMIVARAGRPFVLTLHGGNLPEFAKSRPGRVRRLLNAAAVVTAPSKFLAERMRCYRDDIRVLPNALTLEAYTARERNVTTPFLIWVRAFHSMYNPALLPEVLSQLIGDVPNVRAMMVGPDKGDGSMQQTRDAAIRLGVDERLQFVGAVPKTQIPGLLDRADIFINTTNVDNTPVSVIEALASGLCVISTAVGGLPFLLRDGADALLVPPNDSLAMAAAIRRVLSEPGLSARLSIAARKRALEFEWSIILPQWEALLSDVVKQARG